mmetsp:Transcript_36830/g.118780  ORF Transcript_36830/g.118780 Transcript_36830/m.118780 type:complete len:277 (+) Transcript_36830:223-1053(+)
MPVSVARSAVRLAMLVVEEYEPDEGGPKNKCEQAQEVGLRRELQLVNLRHALRRCDVQIDPAAESEEEAHNAVVHLCDVDDHHAEHHAQTRQKVDQERPSRGHANPGTGEDGVVGHLLRKLVQHRCQGDTPAEVVTAALECHAEEETVAQVVEQVADGHGTDQASGTPFRLTVRKMGLAWCRHWAVDCTSFVPRKGCGGRVFGNELRWPGLLHQSGRAINHGWQQESREDHHSPSPCLCRLVFPRLRDQVRGLEQEEKESTPKEGARGERGQEAIE